MNVEASRNPALGVASEIIEGEAFALTVGEKLSHRLPDLSHPGANIAIPFLFPLLLLAVIPMFRSGEGRIQDERVYEDLLEAIVKL